MTTNVYSDSEVSLTIAPAPGESVAGVCARLVRQLREREAQILQMTVFGAVNAVIPTYAAMLGSLGLIDWPVTWVDGAPCDSAPLAGIQVYAASGDVQRIRLDGKIVGSIFSNDGARHCLLGGLQPSNALASRDDQTLQTLDLAVRALDQVRFSFADTIRTWFFMNEMLKWYDEFNKARTKVYSGISFRSGSVPASTGIGARNPRHTALIAGLWAMQPLEASVRAAEVVSPLQCPAPAYGSSFSRAMEFSGTNGRRLFISGTASIAQDGRTLWKDDAPRQIEETIKVIEAILEARGYSFTDVTRATAYCKHAADARAFRDWQQSTGWEHAPVLVTNCDVCRDDLLFELELDAAQ